jgi:uncharacterized repeat protein (TIGR01451 family)
MLNLRSILMALALSFSAISINAQEQGRLSLQTVVEKAAQVTEADGSMRTELRPVDTAVPGDELIYTVVFTNISAEVAENIRVTNPIPGDLRYVDNSAFGPGTNIDYSVDDGNSFAAPDELMVQLADGEQRPATTDDYTHIRWTLKNPLEAGARGFARYRAVVR